MTTQAVHRLKTCPDYFAALLCGNKTFECRKDDRGFCPGDLLKLAEWCPESREFTGREVLRTVTYIMAGGKFGLEERYVIMGLRK